MPEVIRPYFHRVCVEHPDRPGVALWGEEWVCTQCDEQISFVTRKFLNEFLETGRKTP